MRSESKPRTKSGLGAPPEDFEFCSEEVFALREKGNRGLCVGTHLIDIPKEFTVAAV